jgi:hypothetical protein
VDVRTTALQMRETLKGLQAVAVNVAVDNTSTPERDLIGPDVLAVLQANAELRLRQNGIRVQENVDAVPGRPVLG